jgi:hypothetical protein
MVSVSTRQVSVGVREADGELIAEGTLAKMLRKGKRKYKKK